MTWVYIFFCNSIYLLRVTLSHTKLLNTQTRNHTLECNTDAPNESQLLQSKVKIYNFMVVRIKIVCVFKTLCSKYLSTVVGTSENCIIDDYVFFK